MNEDWPRRPLYEKAYATAYFASRQWIRAARGWLNDDALWARAQRLAAPSGLKADLRAMLDISKYSGHWQGNGQPCAKAIIFCGDLGFPPMTSGGLAPGASQTFGSGHGCAFGKHHAVVDPMDQVEESDENNNTADIDVIC